MLKILSFIIFISLIFTEIKSENSAHNELVNKIENLDYLTILRAVKDNSTDECKKDIIEYLNATLHFKIWALSMFDAAPKIPVGILQGNRKYLGHFDECVRVEHPSKDFVGQYCLLTFNIKLEEDSETITIPDVVEFGLCLPSTCTPSEIENATNFAISLLFYKLVTVTVEEGNCRTSKPRELRDKDWAGIGILIAIGSVALLSTLYEVHHRLNKNSDKPHPLLASFSLCSNGKNLFEVTQKAGQLTALNGIRFFSISWVVLLHSYLVIWSYGPTINLFDIANSVKDPHKIIIMNASISVDTFFFLSGFLLCIVFFREMNRKGSYDVPLQYIHRYIRVTPSYAITILIYSTVYTYMGDGPIWNNINKKFVETCDDSWWSGILYVQNFVDANSNCVYHSWYLSTDMNFYWLSPLILYPIYFWPSYAFYFLGFLLVAAVCTNFTVAYLSEIGASLLTNIDQSEQMSVDYTKFYMRGAPYIIGIATALLICKIQSGDIKIKLNKIQVMIGWVLATGLCLASLYGLVPFTTFLTNKYSSLDAAFYLSLGRVAWGLGLAWIVFACLQGYGGPVNEFLSLGIFQPLAKLSYNVYLLHGIVELYRVGNLRTNINAGDLEIIYEFFGDLTLSFLLAIPFTLLFEMPFGNIERYLTRQAKISPFPRRKKTA